MGLLKKLFVEEIPQEDEISESEVSTYEPLTEVNVQLSNVNTDTLIDDIYVQNDLLDKVKSIFKVEEVINSLPKEMVTETKKATVLSILGSFGLTTTDVGLDGENRVSVLKSVLSKIIEDGENTVSKKKSEIEEYKKAIETLEREISDEQNQMKVSETTIDTEVARLTELIIFIGGAE